MPSIDLAIITAQAQQRFGSLKDCEVQINTVVPVPTNESQVVVIVRFTQPLLSALKLRERRVEAYYRPYDGNFVFYGLREVAT